jgi:hypothetical protein
MERARLLTHEKGKKEMKGITLEDIVIRMIRERERRVILKEEIEVRPLSIPVVDYWGNKEDLGAFHPEGDIKITVPENRAHQ